MKLILAIIGMFLFSVSSHSDEAQNEGQFGEVAKTTVENMYGRDGDVVQGTLLSSILDEGATTEVWSVGLSNNVSPGSVLFEVEVISETGGFDIGESVGSVRVKYLGE